MFECLSGKETFMWTGRMNRMGLQDIQNDWMGTKRRPRQGNKCEMIVSLDVSGSGSDAQDLFLFSEYTACEVPSEWSCRTAQAFVLGFVAALPNCDSLLLSLWWELVFLHSWGRLPGPHCSSMGASTTKVICSSGAVAANCLQGAGQ